MVWGSFGIVHLLSLCIAAGLIFGIYFLLRLLPDRARLVVLFILSLSGISAIIFNLVAWNSPLEYLPFHMCSITAMILPVAVLWRNRTLGNLLLLWCLGALLALVLNQAQADFVIPSATFFFYYIPHTLEFAVTVYLFKFGYIKSDYRCIPSTIGLTLAIYTVVHFINLALNQYYIDHQILDSAGNVVVSNYMFSMDPNGIPLLELFRKIIPYDYWYMYGAFGILAIYLPILYAKQIVKALKARKKKSSR